MGSCCSSITAAFKSLKGSPRELYLTLFLKVCDSFSYFALSQIIVIYLYTEFGLTDIQAGAAYGCWGAAITIWGLMTSFINDNIGVRKALLIGYVITIISLIVMSTTTSLIVLFLCLFVFLPLGNSMGIPMLTIGIRRYTNATNRSFAYGVFYSCMNIGAALSGPLVDFFNIADTQSSNIGGNSISGNRMVIFSSAIATCISLGTAFFFLREIRVAETAQGFDAESGATAKDVEDFKLQNKPCMDTLRDLWKSPTFWRFLWLCLLLANLHAIFRYLDALFPTYLVRTFGPDVPKGSIYSINPAMIIVLTPLVAALAAHYEHYTMIKYGGFVTALSPFFLVGSNTIWAAICFVVMLSIGESIWSPRVYDYTMSVAPEGREASFSALATAPLFLAKIPVGILSGVLMETYIPVNGPQNPQMMWLIIALMTLTSPIAITIFESCVREPHTVQHKNSEDLRKVEDTPNPIVNEAEEGVVVKRKANTTAPSKSSGSASVVDYES